MTAVLEGGEWSAARPGLTLRPGKTRYPFYRRLGGLQGRSGRAENLVPTGIRSRTVQPVVSRYTDWATRPTKQNRREAIESRWRLEHFLIWHRVNWQLVTDFSEEIIASIFGSQAVQKRVTTTEKQIYRSVYFYCVGNSSSNISDHVPFIMTSYARRIFINTAVRSSQLAFRIAV